jgi:hypothetical protein
MTGSKPVPLQAGQITSTTSDFVGRKCVRLRLRTAQTITYMFPQLRNELRRVTLNNKVNSNLVLSEFAHT